MERPALPRWWRGAVFAAAALALFPFLFYVLPTGPLQRYGFVAQALAGAVLGAALAGGMVRRGGADRLAALFGILAALAYAVVTSNPFSLLSSLGVTVPCALLLARRDWPPAPLVVLGFLAQMTGLAAMMRSRGPSSSQPQWPEALAAAGALAIAVGLVAFAARAHSEAPRPLGSAGRLALVAAGAALLVVSWLVGGHLFFLPLWPLALVLLVLPPLVRWKAWPAGAVVVGAIALAGAMPAGVCTADPWSDAMVPGQAPDADAYPKLVTLAQAGGNGPQWQSGGGFTGLRVECPPPVVLFGAGWAVALVVASGLHARRGRSA